MREGGGRHVRKGMILDLAELQLWVKGPEQGSMNGVCSEILEPSIGLGIHAEFWVQI